MKGLSISTSLVAAMGTTILFKCLDYFHSLSGILSDIQKLFFIKRDQCLFKWFILFLVIWGICFLLYYVRIIIH